MRVFDKAADSRLRYSGAILLVCMQVLCLGLIWKVGGLSHALDLSTEFSLTAKGQIVDLWFTPKGELSVLALDEQSMALTVLEEGGQGEQRQFHLSFDELGFFSEVQKVHESAWDLPFAVSDDARKVAWESNNELQVQTLDLRGRILFEKSSKVEDLRAIAFVGDDGGLIAVVDGDRLRVFDAQRGIWGSASIAVGSNWRLWPRGAKLLLTSFSEADLAIVDMKFGRMDVKLKTLNFDDGNAVAVSPGGRVAVGTKSGKVAVIGDEFLAIFYLREARAITSIAFVAEDELLVAGEFPGLIMVSKHRVEPLEVTSERIDLVASHQDRIAMATGSSVTVARLRKSLSLSSRGQVFLCLDALVCSFLSIGLALRGLRSGGVD